MEVRHVDISHQASILFFFGCERLIRKKVSFVSALSISSYFIRSVLIAQSRTMPFPIEPNSASSITATFTTMHDRKEVSSPTSVLASQELPDHVKMENILLCPGHGSNGELSPGISAWKCPTSAKSIRTINPIRVIVDPIAKSIQTGEERGDGKDLISLAVRATSK